MKYGFTLILLAICFCLVSCDSNSEHDKGYEAAWEGASAPSSWWTSREERDGYEQGLSELDSPFFSTKSIQPTQYPPGIYSKFLGYQPDLI